MSTSPAHPPRLTETSYVVLGLVAQIGPGTTSYDLERHVELSIGHFWSFPRSQLYAEPQRLVGLGLLSEDLEEGGRRRRRFTITDQGRAALHEWVAAGEPRVPETRDPGLLRLFFADAAEPQVIAQIASAQLEAARAKAEVYAQVIAQLGDAVDREPAALTVRRGAYAQEASCRFWSEVLDFAVSRGAVRPDSRAPQGQVGAADPAG